MDPRDGAGGGLKRGEVMRKSLGGNVLHAAVVKFFHPKGGQAMSFKVALPAELEDFLQRLDRSDAAHGS